MADYNKFVQLRNAQGQNIFPRVDLTNVESLLAMAKVDGLGGALDLKLDASVINSYSTTEQMNKAISDAIANVQHFAVEVVEELPAVEEAKQHTIYLVSRNKGVKDSDVYDEYILISGKFELIGNTELDLSKYSTTEEMTAAIAAAVADKATTGYVDGELAKKVDKTTTVNGKALSADVVLNGSDITLTEYVAVTDGVIAASDTVSSAFNKLDEALVAINSEGLTGIAGRVETLEDEMDDVEGRLDTAEADIETIEKALDGLLAEGAVQDALDLKANKSDVDAVIGAEGSLTKAVEANTQAIANMGNIVALNFVEINADGSVIA